MLGTGLFAPIYRRLVTAQQRLVTARELVQGAIQAAKDDLDMRQRIAVVGNGTVHPRHGGLIDQHGTVIRFNSCWHYGQTGRRTDILVLNNTGGGGKHITYASDAINLQALASARKFWLVTAPQIASARGDEDFTDAMIERRVSGRPWRYIRARSYWSAKDALDTYGAAVDSRPSSGVLVLFQIMNSPSFWRPITLFGFSHEGWEGHAWDAERALVDDWRGWCALTRATPR